MLLLPLSFNRTVLGNWNNRQRLVIGLGLGLASFAWHPNGAFVDVVCLSVCRWIRLKMVKTGAQGTKGRPGNNGKPNGEEQELNLNGPRDGV